MSSQKLPSELQQSSYVRAAFSSMLWTLSFPLFQQILRHLVPQQLASYACVNKYGLTCHVYKCSFVEGVKYILTKLKIEGVFMGMRGGDPYTCDVEHFSPSTPGCPPFMRINPILNWTYDDVWSFLRECQLEIQSSGGRGEDGNVGYYLPAYQLKDRNSELCGRQKKTRTTSKS
ncbi:hypothetical protein PsorP6_013544 [Peronosclerospora sorghi]|uniref:Uncharacterized protein n=1 Tax=Peronosclerospora sorghi TaxID=230839 RepID=A0ACC0VGB6_9STRA|nr:hypothetical protein PsorP6_013544 [Peronosclerospora sorghi]